MRAEQKEQGRSLLFSASSFFSFTSLDGKRDERERERQRKIEKERERERENERVRESEKDGNRMKGDGRPRV